MTAAQRREWLWALDRSLRIWIHRMETERDDMRSCVLCDLAERHMTHSMSECRYNMCDFCIVPKLLGETCHEAVSEWNSNRRAGHAVMAQLMLRVMVEEMR